MKIGLLTRDENSWCSNKLKEAFSNRGVRALPFSFRDVSVELKTGERFFAGELDIREELSAILVRPIGRGSLEEIVFQLDVLHALEERETPVVNHPTAIEAAADKYRTLSLLRSRGVPVPESVATENVAEASKSFESIGGDVLVKPVFGSRGIGITRISDPDTAERIFRTLRFHRHVILLQRFIPHDNTDVRALVVGERVISAMRRKAETWRTNISQGAKALPIKIPGDEEDLALRAAEALHCEIAGVDLLEGPEGVKVLEVNSQPGWRGLQSVSEVDIAHEIVDYMILKAKGAT